MATAENLRPTIPARLDRMLECAVVSCWKELMPAQEAGTIQIEYQAGTERPLEGLAVWSSSVRGHWERVCGYWMRQDPSHEAGVKFIKDHYSAEFARMLDQVMQHQERFARFSGPSTWGTIQVQSPTAEDNAAARACLAASICTGGAAGDAQKESP